MNVCLYLTHACNLRCRYCFNGHDQRRAMSREVAEAAIDLMFAGDAPTSRGRQLTLFGGEPLLQRPLAEHAVAYARRKAEDADDGIRFQLVTNGTLLDRAAVEFLAHNDVRVAVSLDGCQPAHDANRRFRNGRGSFAATVRGIRLLQEHAPALWLRVFATIDPANVDRLPESFDALVDLGLWDLALNVNLHAPWPEAARERYLVALRALGDRYIDSFRRGPGVALNLFDSKIVTHLTGQTFGRERCNFGCLEVFVAASGRLYPCDRMVGGDDRDDRVIGDVWRGLDVARRDELVRRKESAGDDCRDCEFHHRCVHWCGCVNDVLTGSLDRVGGLWCWFEQRLIEEADRCASILYAEGNERFAERFSPSPAR